MATVNIPWLPLKVVVHVSVNAPCAPDASWTWTVTDKGPFKEPVGSVKTPVSWLTKTAGVAGDWLIKENVKSNVLAGGIPLTSALPFVAVYV